MRTFEIVILFLNLVALLTLYFPLRRSRSVSAGYSLRWLELLPAVLVVITIVHLVVEQYRWQMMPSYVLTAVLSLSIMPIENSAGIMDNQADRITTLINLHRSLDRQGPGDAGESRKILCNLSSLPPKPRIADLGCGNGAGALLLAKHYQCTVMAVDSSSVFIEELTVRAKQAGLESLIIPIHGDMAKLDWPVASVDLVWSEGAAYNLGFERALRLWRPLLANNGIAVVSELSWFTDKVPEPAIAYWQKVYPMMGTEAENIFRADRAGFSVLSTHRLPSSAWWMNYYNPLRDRIKQIEITPATQSVIRETEEEMAVFEKFSNFYGYTFYVLRAM